MDTALSWEVEDCYAGERADRYISELLKEKSRSHIQKCMKDGTILINGEIKKSGYLLKPKDVIEITCREDTLPDIAPVKLTLDIMYEDDDILIVNKKRGMVVHPAPGHFDDTLVNGLLYHCRGNLSGINGVLRPGIVHRIDRDTSGILVVCKNDFSHNMVSEQFYRHSVKRRYYALCHGVIKDDENVIDMPIGRHEKDRKKMATNVANSKSAVTHYKVLERLDKATVIECRLLTGRTHQIRVHMSTIGYPLVGDYVYGRKNDPLFGNGQLLHAYCLGLVHPSTEKYMEWTCRIPDDFRLVLENMNSLWIKDN